MKKFTSVFLAMVLTATIPAGFQAVYAEDTSAEDTQETKTDADNEADADQLLKDLTGSYQELWPVILADDYTQTWIDGIAVALKENPDLPVRDVADWIDGEEFAKCTRSDAANNKNKLVGRINFVKNKLISGE